MNRIRPRRPAALLISAVLLSACETARGDTTWTTTVDTLPGGAIHVVNTPPTSTPGPTWRLEEELRIGSVDAAGPVSFGELKGIAVTAEGRIAVLEAQAQEVRVFDANGAHLATHGRQGAGPGELAGAFGLMRGPDETLWVPDHTNDRMSVFHPDSGFLRSHRVHYLSRGYVWSGVMGEDGRIFKRSITLEQPRRNVLRVFGPDMALLDSLPLPDHPQVDPKDPPHSFYWEAPGGMPYGYMQVPFYPVGVELVDREGRIWSTEFGDPSYRIKRWRPGGDTTLVLEALRPPVEVTQTERDSVIRTLTERLRERGGAAQDWSKIPQVKPAVASMLLTEEGRLWVEVSAPNGVRRYDVYEPDGRYIGTVKAPLDIVPWIRPVVRGDRFWAVVSDEMDVQYVVRARIAPTGASADE